MFSTCEVSFYLERQTPKIEAIKYLKIVETAKGKKILHY